GWARWTPLNAAAIAAYLVGSAGLLQANRGRTAMQGGVGASTIAELMLTRAALAITAYSRVLGKQLQHADGVPVESATDLAPAELADTQRQLDTCQWLIPTLTGGISILNALQGEQQRPTQQLPAILAKPAQWLRAAAVQAEGQQR
ncbi:MAG: hypothetical protein QOH17_3631, partial [Pseudonocardiales bacterium]|nr:hypothetical protein [Pseudonocardiales bacterium]